MALGRMLTRTCTLTSIVDGPPDAYNNPSRVAQSSTSPCYFEPRTTTENVNGQDRAVANDLLVLPPGTEVGRRTRVTLDDGQTFDVDGIPSVFTGGRASHIELKLIRVEGG